MPTMIETPQRGLRWESGEALQLMQDMAKAITELQLEVDVLRKALMRERSGLALYIGVIVSSTATTTVDANSNPVKWTYTLKRAVEDGVVGAWQEYSDSETLPAWNLCESNNAATGRQGNGVDHGGTDYPSGFQMYPAPDGHPVLYFVRIVDDTPTAFFYYSSGEDGTCV